MKKLVIASVFATASLSFSVAAQDSNNERQGEAQQAQQGQQAQQTAEEAEEEALLDEVICRTEPVTGSRTRVNRTCMTRREWDYTAERARREVNNLDRNANRIN